MGASPRGCPARLGGARLRSTHAGSCRWDGPARLRSAPVALLRHHRPAPPPGSDAGPPAPASMEEEEAAGAAPLPAPALAELLADGEPGGDGAVGTEAPRCVPGTPAAASGVRVGDREGKEEGKVGLPGAWGAACMAETGLCPLFLALFLPLCLFLLLLLLPVPVPACPVPCPCSPARLGNITGEPSVQSLTSLKTTPTASFLNLAL